MATVQQKESLMPVKLSTDESASEGGARQPLDGEG